SASPRRLEILRSLGVAPDVRPVDLDETPLPLETPEGLVVRLALAKVDRAAERLSRSAPVEDGGSSPSSASRERVSLTGSTLPITCSPPLLLGADTAVVLEGEIFGKPSSASEAAHMLSRLSGRTHTVMTGLALLEFGSGRIESGVSVTSVTFATLSEEQISAYVATGEPIDKAGAYGIQAGAGRFVERVEGSFTNVVGLPVELFRELLARFGLAFSDLEPTDSGT
ncbi:MAG TPA: Maf family protein, partial [Actinomycetota bacterium]